jgi:hypothetical protein
MIFVYLSWLSILLLFVSGLYGLHTIAIYTYTPLQRQVQQTQLRRLVIIRNVLCPCACILLCIHFIVFNDPRAEESLPVSTELFNVST